tara:strand:- start:426 stop:569 length:144 start_codon:yes stop_codon:yes gene_type:complete
MVAHIIPLKKGGNNCNANHLVNYPIALKSNYPITIKRKNNKEELKVN